MTEAQRNYLADLAGRKGVRLSNTDNWSVAETSAKIEELKTMPDVKFDDITAEQDQKINALANGVVKELHKWTFQK